MNTGAARGRGWWQMLLAVLLAVMCAAGGADAFTLNVVEKVKALDGSVSYTPISGGFRWLLEEDNTNLTVPNAKVANSIGVDIHNSHAPVVSNGTSAGLPSVAVTANAKKRFFVSVLPDAGYAGGGTTVAAGQTEATVVVNKLPLPTAQISVLVFKDHNPINNAPDTPAEPGLSGFSIIIYDAAGQVSQDAFGNPLGTTYAMEDGEFVLDGDGNPVVDEMGTGIVSDANGQALIKYIPPGKYGVQVIPPQDGINWVQTATIEGTKTVDAWVKADEPPLFVEGFGTGFNHVFFGFVNPAELPWAAGGPGTATVTGRNVFNHFSRPPTLQGFFSGPPVAECWIGINDPVTAQGMVAVPCDGDSNFTITGVPAGTWQLVTWDTPLDALFGFNTITVADGETKNLGDVLSYRWFGTLKGKVFLDQNENGFPDAGEVGLPERGLNIRFRDGTVYQATVTDPMGEYEFAEVFPFFKWLVAEVDFATLKATGMTAAVDYGGQIPAGFDEANPWLMPTFNALNPQPQVEANPNTGNNLSRTETGPVLLEAMHLFLNQTNVIDWGKNVYAQGDNGGISGIVFYSVTRAENDPRFGVGDAWEPGVPRVQVNLYLDENGDGVIDDRNGNGRIELADVDNHPLKNFPGPEDVDRNKNGVLNWGDAVNVVHTDSWDDNKPTGCIQDLPVIHGKTAKECFDNFGTWNQVRPGVFDGGYAFASYFPGGKGTREIAPLVPGFWIVETVPPPGYQIVKEEDKNVDFGSTFTPSKLLLAPVCVGDPHTVPPFLSLFPDQQVPAPFAGTSRPLCDRRQVELLTGKNAAADFHVFTEVPKAARAVGFANNDLAAEFDPTSPIYGEKASPTWIPVSFRDFAGNEVARVYTDEFGSYNALLPSTFTINAPTPTGVSPNMLTLTLNDPGPVPDPKNPGQMIVDPSYKPQFSVTPWTFHYEPGRTTYLDTPLVPLAAFATNPSGVVPDFNFPAGTPVVSSVNGPDGGPQVCVVDGTQSITITALTSAARDNGFGTVAGSVTVGGTELEILTWSATAITATVPTGVTTGQLVVTRGDNGQSSQLGITLLAGTCTDGTVVRVPQDFPTIQAAIDDVNTTAGDVILVASGMYNEAVILYKEVRLQGAGAGTTTITATMRPLDRLAAWHTKVRQLLGTPDADPFAANEAPGIMVIGNTVASPFANNPAGPHAVIDGFTILGSIAGGGIDINGNASYVEVSNNKITGNQGTFGGGIVVGSLPVQSNGNVVIRNNQISQNGGIQGGGGVVLNAGSHNYLVEGNLISGNFSRFNGGGVAHVGLSTDGIIRGNKILFNEIFYGLVLPGTGDGAGIFVGGDTLAPSASGSVTIEGNLIQGNLAGAGNGGGIRAAYVNAPVGDDPNSLTYVLNIFDNIIVNNVAGLSGAGISLQDVVNVNIVNNTVANNDTTSTATLAFPAGSLNSAPQPSGIVAGAHGGALAAVVEPDYANPLLVNNIIWHNRSFYNDASLNGGAGGLLPNPTSPYWDLQVVGLAGAFLNPTKSILPSLSDPFAPGHTYDGSNIVPDANGAQNLFMREYKNVIQTSTVLDEGGNAISVRFSPLMEGAGNYHISCASPAIDVGDASALPALAQDIDGQARPNQAGVDIGADEFWVVATPKVTVLRPNGGELFLSGSQAAICWTAPVEASSFSLFYSVDNGLSWRTISNNLATPGYLWTVPATSGTKAGSLVRVVARNGAGINIGNDRSDAAFAIQVVKVVSPNGGETLYGGNTVQVAWQSGTTQRPTKKVRIQLSTNNGSTWTTLATLADPPSITLGSHTATVTLPVVTAAKTQSKIRVQLLDAVGSGLGNDVSDGPFSLLPLLVGLAATGGGQ